jgi:hypothetical protein
MVRFITTKEIIGELDSLFRSAQKHIYIVCPYLQISNDFYDRLKSADGRGIPIIFIHRHHELKEDELERILGISNSRLFHIDNLHSKCYLNETKILITSLNLYEYSEKNHEMGIRISKDEEPSLYNEVAAEVFHYQQIATEIISKNSTKLKSQYGYQEVTKVKFTNTKSQIKEPPGYCIRCGCEIIFHPNFPLCSDCYDIWSRYGDTRYPENHCHSCRRQYRTTYGRPICNKC